MPDDTSRRMARPATKPVRARTDFATVIGHWLVALLFLVSVLVMVSALGAINVLTLRGGRIAELSGFIDPDLHRHFDLPRER